MRVHTHFIDKTIGTNQAHNGTYLVEISKLIITYKLCSNRQKSCQTTVMLIILLDREIHTHSIMAVILWAYIIMIGS